MKEVLSKSRGMIRMFLTGKNLRKLNAFAEEKKANLNERENKIENVMSYLEAN